jgi:hypothetical protein
MCIPLVPLGVQESLGFVVESRLDCHELLLSGSVSERHLFLREGEEGEVRGLT